MKVVITLTVELNPGTEACSAWYGWQPINSKEDVSTRISDSGRLKDACKAVRIAMQDLFEDPNPTVSSSFRLEE